MSIISIVLVLIVVGIIMWLINTFIPMAAPIKTLLNAVVVVFLILWILQALGLLSIGNLRLS